MTTNIVVIVQEIKVGVSSEPQYSEVVWRRRPDVSPTQAARPPVQSMYPNEGDYAAIVHKPNKQ